MELTGAVGGIAIDRGPLLALLALPALPALLAGRGGGVIVEEVGDQAGSGCGVPRCCPA